MRSLWKGAVTFGLVNIPVELYSASRASELKFKLLHKKDLSEIRYARICKADEKEVPWDEIVKGFELENGEMVVMTDEDFERATPEKSKSIEIIDFTEEKQIDPIYYETPYYLQPQKGSVKAYNLLRDALAKSKKVAIGHFVLRTHEHLAVIKPYGKFLLLIQLRFENELVSMDELKLYESEPVNAKELDMAMKLIDQLTKPFHPEDYADTYVEVLMEAIEAKAKGKKFAKPKGSSEAKPSKVHDIMSLLKASLEQGNGKKKSIPN